MNEDLFIQECSQKAYPKLFHQNKERIIFEFCYLYKNVEYKTEELADALNFRHFNDGQREITPVRVSQLRTKVAKRLLEEFEDEMIADGVKIEKIEDGCQGAGNPLEKPWRIAFDWLWECKFPRWEVDLALNTLIDSVDSHPDWIDFRSIDVDQNRAFTVTPRPQSPNPKIKVNIPYFMSIKFPSPKGYFLLFNRGFVTRLCICPSLYAAPNNQVVEEYMLLPQDNAEGKDIIFSEIGKEEFIGVQVDKPLTLQWLNSNKEELLPTLTLERIESFVG